MKLLIMKSVQRTKFSFLLVPTFSLSALLSSLSINMTDQASHLYKKEQIRMFIHFNIYASVAVRTSP